MRIVSLSLDFTCRMYYFIQTSTWVKQTFNKKKMGYRYLILNPAINCNKTSHAYLWIFMYGTSIGAYHSLLLKFSIIVYPSGQLMHFNSDFSFQKWPLNVHNMIAMRYIFTIFILKSQVRMLCIKFLWELEILWISFDQYARF